MNVMASHDRETYVSVQKVATTRDVRTVAVPSTVRRSSDRADRAGAYSPRAAKTATVTGTSINAMVVSRRRSGATPKRSACAASVAVTTDATSVSEIHGRTYVS